MNILICCSIHALPTKAQAASAPPEIRQLPVGILETPWYLSSLDWRFFEGKTLPTDLSNGDTVKNFTFGGLVPQVQGVGRESKHWQGEGWFVTQFRADSILPHTKHVLFWMHKHYGETSLWLDGRTIRPFRLDERSPRRDIFFGADLDSGIHTLAVHYRDSEAQSAFRHLGAFASSTGFGLSVSTEASALATVSDIRHIEQLFIALGAALFLLAFLHLLFFIFSPSEKAHLFYALETICLMVMMLQDALVQWFFLTDFATTLALIFITRRFLQMLIVPALVAMLTSLFEPQPFSRRHRWFLIAYAALCTTELLAQTLYPILSGNSIPDTVLLFMVILPSLVGIVEIIRLLVKGVLLNKGAWFMASGGLLFLGAALLGLGTMVVSRKVSVSFGVEFIVAGMGFQLGMSLFLAWRSAQTRRNLMQSLEEVRTLSAQMLGQERERFRTESLAREAALNALKMQINPHFLFNTLASIRTLSRIQPEVAHEAISQLSALFRYALQSAKHETVTLGEELRIVQDYLALERLRFEERMKWSFHIKPELESLPIPPMTLQILVENAVKHGIEEERHSGTISIHAALKNEELTVRVLNTGKLRQNTRGNGIGLEIARERLRMIFGDSATITLQEIHPVEAPCHVCAELHYSPSFHHSNTFARNNPHDSTYR
ncbi:MAG: histidine kinase [Candidatus Kapabacteria bacterium]|nr:histidine kinase [Candidatus Kapabacteria bacterium]